MTENERLERLKNVRLEDLKSKHQQQVEEMLRLLGQELPSRPTWIDKKTAVTRAQLLLRVVRNFIRSMGLDLTTIRRGDRTHFSITDYDDPRFDRMTEAQLTGQMVYFNALMHSIVVGNFSVVGVPDNAVLSIVDEYNIRKGKRFAKEMELELEGKSHNIPEPEEPDLTNFLVGLALMERQREKENEN